MNTRATSRRGVTSPHLRYTKSMKETCVRATSLPRLRHLPLMYKLFPHINRISLKRQALLNIYFKIIINLLRVLRAILLKLY